MFELKGKTAIVTGASSGLGIQMAKCLAAAGADIAIAARRLEKLEQVKKEIEGFGVNCIAVKTDVTIEAEVEAAVNQVINQWGKIDILVNNSGTSAVDQTERLSESDWNRVIDTNVKGLFLFSKHAGKHMIEKSYGKIINISSMYGLVASPPVPVIAYYTSKGGATQFTRGLAAEWSKHNITVNAIAPGYFVSEMTEDALKHEFLEYIKFRCPMGRIGNPGELDGALLLLSSDASSYITGQTIYVDGGWTCS